MSKSFDQVELLVGDKVVYTNSFSPYDPILCNFLDTFSKELNKKSTKVYPDLKSLSFWCRKKNIDRIKKNFLTNEIRAGKGLIFHIAPSNVPTNFMYSLIFGLLTGNSNIVRVPSKSFNQVKIICNLIKDLLKMKKFNSLKKNIKIVKYGNENENFTKYISSLCDVRIIWGGDKSIENIRRFPIKSRSFDLTFADRYSICLIDTDQLEKLNNLNLKLLTNKFYNDTYSFDQNACSSPHLIFWKGKKNMKAREKFWNNLKELVEKKYDLPEKATFDKFSKLCIDSTNLKNFQFQKKFGEMIYIVNLKKIDKKIEHLRGKWGYFYEHEIKDINEIKKVLSSKFQTLTYFGVKKNLLDNFAKSNLSGIDRIVPIGQALEISLVWDGYDINKTLTRVVDIK
jgi:hypothetical protein